MTDQNVSAETPDTGTSVAVFIHPDTDMNVQFDIVVNDDGTTELWSSVGPDDEAKVACMAVFHPNLGGDGALATLLMIKESALKYATDQIAAKLGLHSVSPTLVLPGDV